MRNQADDYSTLIQLLRRHVGHKCEQTCIYASNVMMTLHYTSLTDCAASVSAATDRCKDNLYFSTNGSITTVQYETIEHKPDVLQNFVRSKIWDYVYLIFRCMHIAIICHYLEIILHYFFSLIFSYYLSSFVFYLFIMFYQYRWKKDEYNVNLIHRLPCIAIHGNATSQTPPLPAPGPCTNGSSSLGARRRLGMDAASTAQQGC